MYPHDSSQPTKPNENPLASKRPDATGFFFYCAFSSIAIQPRILATKPRPFLPDLAAMSKKTLESTRNLAARTDVLPLLSKVFIGVKHK